MIEVTGLTVRFAGVTPIDDVSVVFPGGTCGLIGPNGAGKTTFFNVLSGFVKPASGSITAFGFPTQDSLTLLAAALIGGIYSLWGAVVAGAFSQLAPFIFQAQWGVDPNFLLIIFGVGLLQVLLTAPGGIVQQLPKDLLNLARLIIRLVQKLIAPRRSST